MDVFFRHDDADLPAPPPGIIGMIAYDYGQNRHPRKARVAAGTMGAFLRVHGRRHGPFVNGKREVVFDPSTGRCLESECRTCSIG
jgi:hypothetical protein